MSVNLKSGIKMKKYINAPNIITTVRILGTLALVFIEPFCAAFYIIWTVCGVSDVLDGTVARMLKKESKFGARLDSIADIMFYLLMLYRVLPTLIAVLPRWIWIIVCVIAATRSAAYLTALIKFKRFASLHSYLNKLSGFMLFLVPYFISLSWFWIYCVVLCGIGLASSFEELLIHLLSRHYQEGRQTIIGLKIGKKRTRIKEKNIGKAAEKD